MGEYMTWKKIEETYPDEWIILGEVRYDSDEALLGGVILERCTDKTVDDAILKYRELGIDTLHLRTSTYFNNGVQMV